VTEKLRAIAAAATGEQLPMRFHVHASKNNEKVRLSFVDERAFGHLLENAKHVVRKPTMLGSHKPYNH
jgi:hypothetical protein